MKKHLKKTICLACGNKVIIGRKNTKDVFPPLKNCATCRTLGVKKAIAQREALR